MDSVTQFVLGAAVAEAATGRRSGRVAALVGGIVGTLPDLDVFVPLGGPVEDFTYHRSATHSLLVLTLATPLIAWLVHRILGPPRGSFGRWTLAVWLVLITHALLDAMTVYGTQLLWPLSEYPFGLGSVFIIDPLYTLPLAAGVLAALCFRRGRLGWRLNAAALALGTAYLGFGAAAQAAVRDFAEASLARQDVECRRLEVLAAPFTSLAWRIVVVLDDGYAVAYHSLLEPAPELRLRRFEHRPQLLEPLAGFWPVERLRWFTKGVYAVEEEDGAIVLTDLRMGVEPDRYAFRFRVGARRGGSVTPTAVERVRRERSRDGDLGRVLGIIGGAPTL